VDTQNGSVALRVVGLSHRYAARPVLSAIQIELAPGRCLGLLGPNGSGKSTLMRCLSGRLLPERGEIFIAGHSLACDPLSAKRALGFAPSPELLPDALSVRQCLDVYAHTRGLSTIPPQSLQLLERLGAARWLDSFIGTLSLGTRQKISVVLALLAEPDEQRVLLLDEVFNGLDPMSAYELKQSLRERISQGLAVVFATHGLDFAAELFDQLLLLHEGQALRTWDTEELAALRSPGQLEQAIVGVLRGAA
jgi:ABC-2 type transport system ATP-binding protein